MRRRRSFAWGLGACAWLLLTPAHALSPFYFRTHLIAGCGESGFQDGPALQARFHDPHGIAISADGKTLYVADTGNNAVRAVHLDQANEVATVCGNGKQGDSDVSGSAGSLDLPSDVALSSDQSQLYIYDFGNRKIKAWDFSKRQLRTVFAEAAAPRRVPVAAGLLLSPKGDRLYWADPAAGALMAGDLDSGKMSALLLSPLMADDGLQLGCTPDGLRVYDSAQEGVSKVAAVSGNLHDAAWASLTNSGSVILAPGYPLAKGLQGLSPLGLGAKQSGFIAWDPTAGQFDLVENGNGPLSVSDYQGHALGARPFFVGPLRLAYDQERTMVYASLTGSHILMAMRDDNKPRAVSDTEHGLLFNHDFAKKKPAGVTRILFFGSSLMFFDPAAPKEDPNYYVPTQFELYLNLMNALESTGRQYEVLFCVNRGSAVGSGLAYLLTHPEMLEKHEIDEVVFPVTMDWALGDTTRELSDETVDDVPVQKFDTEWAAKPYKERAKSLGPEYRKILDYCRKNGCEGLTFTAEGEPNFVRICDSFMGALQTPAILDGTLAIEQKIALKVSALCQAKGVKPFAFVVPSKDLSFGGERDQTCITWPAEPAAKLSLSLSKGGIPTADLVDSLRMMDPVLYPMWADHNGHMSYRGQGWLAYVMAWHFLKELEPAPPAESAKASAP